MENAKSAGINGCRRFKAINSSSGSFTADQLNFLIFNKMVEGTHGITSTAYTGNNGIRKPSFLFQDLLLNLSGDHSLEISYNGRERMGAHNGTQAVVGIINSAGPFPHGLGYRIL